MTLAVVLATEAAASGSTPAADLSLRDGTVIGRLLAQLESLGAGDRRVIARPESAARLREQGCETVESKGLADDLREIARLAKSAGGPVFVVHGDVVAHREVLARLAYDKAPAAAVVTRTTEVADEPTRPVARVGGGRIVSAGSPYHQVTDPNARFGGVLWVSAQQTAALADVAERLAGLVDRPDGLAEVAPVRRLWAAAGERPDEGTGAGDPDGSGPAAPLGGEYAALTATPVTGDDAAALLLVGLVRSGVKVAGRGDPRLLCERVLDPVQAEVAERALDTVDEDRVRLDAAVKNNDGFFTTYAVSTYSRYIARWAARHRLTPNIVTSVSMGVSVVAAFLFATGQRWGMVLGAVTLYFAFVLDCVDGQLARYTRRFSTLGAWLDATFDRAKEYVAFAGLAAGSTAAAAGSSVHGGDVWFLAVAALTVQTCRHMIDFSFNAVWHRTPPPPIPVLALDAPDDSALDEPEPRRRRPKGGGVGHLAVWLSARSEKVRAFHWFKKIIVLPIGERFALIAVTAALFDARVTFLALLTWGAVAGAYTLAGRFLRSLTLPRSVA